MSLPSASPFLIFAQLAKSVEQSTHKPVPGLVTGIKQKPQRAPKVKRGADFNAYTSRRESAFSTFYREWNNSRDARDTHFPVNPTPVDCLMVLHGLRGRDDLVSCVSLRRLNKRDEYFPSHLPVREATKAYLVDMVMGMEPTHLDDDIHRDNGIDSLQEEERVYITQSSFVRSRNRQGYAQATHSYLQSTAVVYVDMDVYNSQHKDKPLDEVVSLIESRLLAHNIPLPVIVGSGKGLYLKWFLSERLALDQTKLTAKDNEIRWKSVQSRLINLLLDFGADPKVRDLTRVLRLTGTRHEVGTRVHVKRDDGQYHKLEELEETVHFLPALKENDPLAANLTAYFDPSNTKGSPQGKNLSNVLLDALSGVSGQRWRADDSKLLQFEHITLYYKEKFEAKGKISELSLAHRYFRVFLDLCSLAQLRGGIAAGMRDEFLLWIHTSLFLAHLIRVEDVPLVSKQFALICQNEFNANDQGYLQALKERMKIDQSHRDALAKGYARKKEIEKRKRQEKRRTASRSPLVGGFTKKRAHKSSLPSLDMTSIRPQSDLPLSARFSGAGIHTYTPSCATLIHRLGLSLDEQQHMLILTGERERKTRRQLRENKAPARYERNRSIVHDHTVSTLSPRALAEKYGLSLSSIYEIIKQANKWLEYSPLEKRSIPVLTSGRTLPVHAPKTPSASLWCRSQGAVYPVGRFANELPSKRLSSTTPASSLMHRELNPTFLSFISSSFSLISKEGGGVRGSVNKKTQDNSSNNLQRSGKNGVSKPPVLSRSHYIMIWHKDLLVVNDWLAKQFQAAHVPFKSACYAIPLRSFVEGEKTVKRFLGLSPDPAHCLTHCLLNLFNSNMEIDSTKAIPQTLSPEPIGTQSKRMTSLELQRLRYRCTAWHQSYTGPQYSLIGFTGAERSRSAKALNALTVLGVTDQMRWLESDGANPRGKPTGAEKKLIARILGKVKKDIPPTDRIAWYMECKQEEPVQHYVQGDVSSPEYKELSKLVWAAVKESAIRESIRKAVAEDAKQLEQLDEAGRWEYLEKLVTF